MKQSFEKYSPYLLFLTKRGVCGEFTRRKARKLLLALFNFVSRYYFDSEKTKLGLIRFSANMASFGPKEVEPDQSF